MKTPLFIRSILLSIIAVHLLYGQYNHRENAEKRRGSERFAQAITLKTWQRPIPGEDRSEVTVLILTMNDILQFIKTDSGYTSNYEISLSLRDSKNNLLDTRVLTKRKTVGTYAQTNAKDTFQRETVRFRLLPGVYHLLVTLNDRAASIPFKVEEEITVEGAIAKAVRLSSPLFFYAGKNTPDVFLPDSVAIVPSVSEKHRYLYTSSELYLSQANGDINVISSIYDSRNTLVRRQTKSLSLPKGHHQLITGIPEALPFGQYRLTLSVTAGGNADSLSAYFSVLWSKHASTRPDLTTTVQLMQYLLSRHDFKELLQLDTEKQKQFLHRYWQDRDPDPSTARNELQEEFYQRAAFAITNFTASDQEGWETDRGKIYILYGPPETIERPVSQNGFEKFEIWDYPRIRKKFLFVDQNGTGHYILQSETG